MIYFLDSSALVKRYVSEVGSSVIRGLVRRRRHLAASGLALVEVPAALWRRAREGDLATAQARQLAAMARADLEEVELVEVRTSVLERAAELVAQHPLRAYDSVQLASALRLGERSSLAVTFVCADAALSAAADACGLRGLPLG